MIFKSLVQAFMIWVAALFIGVVFGAADLFFTPLGFSVIVGTFFLEIFGNRW